MPCHESLCKIYVKNQEQGFISCSRIKRKTSHEKDVEDEIDEENEIDVEDGKDEEHEEHEEHAEGEDDA